MRIAVISDTRLPTRADGGHGLGMSAYSLATGLAHLMGHEVDLIAGEGSEYEPGQVHTFWNETEAALWVKQNLDQYDAVLDTSHSHRLSSLMWRAPVVNRLCDLECPYNPPNIVVNSCFMLSRYPKAQLINTGIDAPGAYFSYTPGRYLVYASAATAINGWSNLTQLEQLLDNRMRVLSNVAGPKKWEALAGASALIMLSVASAAPRLPIEAGLMGTPTLCLAGDGAEHHVEHGVTGYVCHNLDELATQVACVPVLDRVAVRAWFLEHHSYDGMIRNYNEALQQVASGGTW